MNMNMTFALASYQLQRVLMQRRILQDHAAKVVTVSEGDVTERPPAYALPGQIDRVKAVQHQTTWEAERNRLTSGPVQHMKTMAYRIDNMAYVGGILYGAAGRHHLRLGGAPAFPWPKGEVVTIDEGAIIGNPLSDMYFGHFVTDDALATMLAMDFGQVFIPESRNRKGWSHALPYREMMGLSVPILQDAFLRRFWLLHDHTMNAHRRNRMTEIRRRVRTSVPADRDGHGVLILRTSTGQARTLENEMDMAEVLSARGFTTIDPATESAADIVRKISGAAVVVSVEGSAIAHGLLSMAEGGAIVTVQPPCRFNNVWKDFTDFQGLKYGYVVADGDETSFRVDIDDLLRTIDLVTG